MEDGHIASQAAVFDHAILGEEGTLVTGRTEQSDKLCRA